MVDRGDEVALECRDVGRGRLLTSQHPQVVRRVTQVVTRRDRVEALTQPVDGGEKARDDRGDSQDVGPPGGLVAVPQRRQPEGGSGGRERRPENGEGIRPVRRRGRDRTEDGHQGVGQPAARDEFGREGRGSVRVGQFAVDQQGPHLLEAAVSSQLGRVVLPVVVEALAPADIADRGLGDRDPGQAAGDVDETVDRRSVGGRRCGCGGHARDHPAVGFTASTLMLSILHVGRDRAHARCLRFGVSRAGRRRSTMTQVPFSVGLRRVLARRNRRPGRHAGRSSRRRWCSGRSQRASRGPV